MPKDDKLPPPSRGGRTQPDMMGEDPSIYNRLSSLAGQQGEGMGGGGEQEAAQMVMAGAQQLLQAAKMHPALEPIIMQALGVLRQGVSQLGGGGEMGGGMGGEEMPPTKPRRRTRPPRGEREEVGEEMPY